MSSILLFISIAFAQYEIKPYPMPETLISVNLVNQCLEQQLEYYPDLCAETEDNQDQKLAGVTCAVDGIKRCLFVITFKK